MPITVECSCGNSFQVADRYARKRIKCAVCDLVLDIPSQSAFVPKSRGADLNPEIAAASEGEHPLKHRSGIVLLACAFVLIAAMVSAAWCGVQWLRENTGERVVLRMAYARALAQHNEAITISNEAEHAKNRGDSEAAIRAYSAYLNHPGSMAFSRQADEDRKANREMPSWLVEQEKVENQLEAHVSSEKEKLIRAIFILVRTCQDDEKPDSPEPFAENFRRMCARLGIDPTDSSSMTVKAYQFLESEMVERKVRRLARTTAVTPGPPHYALPLTGPRVTYEQILESDRRRAEKDAERRFEEAVNSRPASVAARDRQAPPTNRPRPLPDPSRPRFSLVAENLIAKAKSQEKSRRLTSARDVYDKIMREYPGTEQAVVAEKRLKFLENK